MKAKQIALGALLLTVAACTDTCQAGLSAYGEPHTIICYSGGVKIGEWTSTGKVQNEGNSDGYQFMDSASQKQIRVSGECIIFVK